MNISKWMKIYNSLIRIKFYAFLDKNKPHVLTELDKHYQEFVDSQGLNSKNDKVRFFGGDTLIGFSYLILVRTNEYIKNDLTSTYRKEVLKIDNWKIFNVTSFDDLITRYSINVTKLSKRRSNGKLFYTNENEKLVYFISKLRNSLGHFRYENPDLENIKLTDINPNSGQLEMECSFNYSHFLNFCMDYCDIINKKLYELYHR